MSKPIDKEILICPQCKHDNLKFNSDSINCRHCKSNFRFKNEKYYFSGAVDDDIENPLDKFKHFFKKYYRLYAFLIYLISPVYANRHLKKFIKRNVTGKNRVVLNLGSGNSNLSDGITNVDMFPYDNIDLTCDIQHLPLLNNSIDIIITMAVLEHVPEPELVLNEIRRVFKDGGIVYTFFPFIQGFHASPDDYSRLTEEGIKRLFSDFEIIEVTPGSGPTSGFLWIFQEWLAILLSFGIKPLHTILHLLIMLLTFPLKFIDIILIKHPMAKNIASGFTIVAKK